MASQLNIRNSAEQEVAVLRHVQNERFHIVEIPDFLTKTECDRMISYALKVGMQRSLTSEGKSKSRTSSQAWIDRFSQNCEVQDIVDKICMKSKALTGQQDEAFFEPLQLVRYKEGEQFKAHRDGHDRHYTINIYLNDEFVGGETSFPLIQQSVKPETGKAVIWRNLTDTDRVVKDSLHQGCAIVSGTKFICTQWIKHADFFSKHRYRGLFQHLA